MLPATRTQTAWTCRSPRPHRHATPHLVFPARPFPAGRIPRRDGAVLLVPVEGYVARGELVQVLAEPKAAGDPDVGELRLHGVELFLHRGQPDVLRRQFRP